MKIASSLKKTAAAAVAAAVVTVTLPFSGVSAASETEFDPNNVVLRFGVMSDIHQSYAEYSVETIKNATLKYTNSVAELNALADNKLDALLLCGDYTGTGQAVQAETFASASKAAIDAINADKAESEKTKFIMTYGNHDTEWQGQMNYTEWESLLDKYGLLKDNVDNGPELSGCYKTTIERNGKTYHFISLETETYNNPSNTFRTDVLEWLDSELATAVKADPDSYVYIISHGPIKETGVYGADIEFEKDADWGTAEAGYSGTVTRDGNTYATSSEIDAVLSKYPQVVYFSGHTHFTNELESSIMSNGKYTAVTVSALGAGERFSSVSKYLDGSNYDITPRNGYALYVEVDANGNQRMRRIEAPYSYAETELTNVTEVTGVQSNTEGHGLLNGIVVGGVDIKSVTSELNDTVKPWVMSAPKADKSHLTKYTADARRRTPVFAEDASVNISELYAIAGTVLRADVRFGAATCETNIIRYEISLVDSDGNITGTQWALGNWTPNKNGVLTGNNHYDATEFKYSGVDLPCGSNLIGCSVRVTAVDEFGGRASIQSEPISREPDRLIEDTNRPIYDNLFNVTPERAVASENQSGVEFTLDKNGSLVTTIDTSYGYRNAVYMVSESKYNDLVTDENTKAPFKAWAYPGTNPQNLTDFSADDTFVWEADFSATEGEKNIFFHLRTPDVNLGDETDETTVAAWRTDYTGVLLNNSGVYLSMFNDNRAVSDKFKLTDTNTHHIKVISSPKFISIWIDGEQLCDNAEFNPSAWSDSKFAGCFKSDKMIPTMAIHMYGGTKLTVSNQKLYYYYIADEVKGYKGPDELVESDMFDGITAERAFALSNKDYVTNTVENGKLTTTVNLSEVQKDPHTNICYITSAKNYTEKGSGIYKSWASSGSKNAKYFTDLSADDSFIYEADFTIDAINAIYFHLRTPDLNFNNGIALWQTDYTGVRINGSGVGLYMVQKQLETEYPIDLADGEQHHIIIKSEPEAVTVIIDGKTIFKDAAFNKAAGVAAGLNEAAFDSDDMIPTMAVFVMGVDMELSGQKLGKIADVTPYIVDSQNLLNSDAGSLASGLPVTAVTHFEQNSFFSDMRYTNPNLDSKYYYWQNQAFLFGSGNSKYKFDTTAGYLLSGLMTAENGTLENYSSRMTVTFGRYNGNSAFAFVQNTTLYFYYGGTLLKTFNLADLYGYKIGDTVRITALITPFGFEYYFDGNKVYSYDVDVDPTLIDYSVLSLGISGTKGAWRDIVFYENTDNGKLYAEKLGEKAGKILKTKGVYYTDSAKATANEIINAAENMTGKSNATLKAYVRSVNSLLEGSKVVNNMVAEGKTAVESDFERTFNDDGTWWVNYGIALFADGECPITAKDTWSVDFDFTVNRVGVANPHEVRLAFAPYGNGDEYKDVKGGAMIQDAALHAINISNAETGYKLIGSGTKSIRLVGGKFHVNFSVTPTDDGKHIIRTVLTSTDGGETYMDISFTADNITEIKPYIYYRAADISFSNLCVSYDLTDDFASLENVCESKDLSDIAVICAKDYENAYKVGSAILSNRDYYTRDEIRSAVAALKSAAGSLEKYGDVNLDEVTDIRDLISLKKILAATANETVTADIDGDGDILASDLALLRKHLLTK